jgi:hypothetical protein
MTTTPERPPLDSPEAIVDALDVLIGPDDRRRSSLWVMWVDADRRPLPVVMPIDDRPEWPDPELVDAIMRVLASAEPDAEVLFTLTRAGNRRVGEADRAWFHALHRSARSAAVRVGSIHLATERGTRPLHPDDVI